MPPPKNSARQKLTKGEGPGRPPWFPPRQGSSPTVLVGQLKKTPAAIALCRRPGLFPAGRRDCHLRSLGPSPPRPPRVRRIREDSSPPYSQAPTDFRAAVTTDENPGPLEESLLLIPSSLSMNTQQHPRSRSSYSGGRPNPRATSGAGSRCGESARPSAPRSLAPSQPAERILNQPRVPDPEGARILAGAPPPRGPGAGDLGEPARHPHSPTTGAARRARYLGADPGALAGAGGRLTFGTPGRRPRPPRAPRRASPGTRAGRGRVPGRPRAGPAPAGGGQRGARRPSGGRREASRSEAEGRPRGARGARAPPLTRGLWGSPWRAARPAQIHA